MVVIHLDLIAQEKAVLPSLEVLSGEASKERRKETIFLDAFRAATARGVLSSERVRCVKH